MTLRGSDPGLRHSIRIGESGEILTKAPEGASDLLCASLPVDAELHGRLLPDTPSSIWRQPGGSEGARIWGPLQQGVRVLKWGGFAWFRIPRESRGRVEDMLRHLGMRYRTSLLHIYPPRRKSLKHHVKDERLTKSLMTAHAEWMCYQKTKPGSDQWLDSTGDAFPRRPTSVFVDDVEAAEGIVSDTPSFQLSSVGAFLAPVSPTELTAGPGVRTKARNPTSLDLARMLIQMSCPEGGTVLDPFCGSGSFVIAALLEGRSAMGIEVVQERAEHARERLEWWEDNQTRVAPLRLTTVDKLLTGAPRSGLSLRVKLPVALCREIERLGGSVPATMRAALSGWLRLPLSHVQDAAPPACAPGPRWWEGRQKTMTLSITKAQAALLEIRGKEGFDVVATARSALKHWASGEEAEQGAAPRG